MIEFSYRAKDQSDNSIVEGKISADNQMAAADILKSKNLFPIKIETSSAEKKVLNLSFFNKVSAKKRVVFTRQLATLVKAGLPITQALSTAIEQVNDKNFKAKLQKIFESVEGGQTLANSFARYPEIFNPVYISLLRAGEESGTLDETLTRLADQQENDAQIVSKVRGALIYPAIVLVTIVLVLVYMLATIMPQIQNLYIELKKPLPGLTQFTIILSQLITKFWPLTILATLALVFGLRAYFKTPHGAKLVDKLKMNLPVFGMLFRKLYMARFSRTLGSLVNSGVPLLESLRISAQAVNNRILSDIIMKAADEVKSGKSLSGALSKNEYFLKLVPQMIKVGEESGTLGEMLNKVAAFYEQEVDQAVKNLSTIIEPILMIVLGGMVFFIIIAILYPIYSLVGGGININPTSSVNTTQSQ